MTGTIFGDGLAIQKNQTRPMGICKWKVSEKGKMELLKTFKRRKQQWQGVAVNWLFSWWSKLDFLNLSHKWSGITLCITHLPLFISRIIITVNSYANLFVSWSFVRMQICDAPALWLQEIIIYWNPIILVSQLCCLLMFVLAFFLAIAWMLPWPYT